MGTSHQRTQCPTVLSPFAQAAHCKSGWGRPISLGLAWSVGSLGYGTLMLLKVKALSCLVEMQASHIAI